MEMGSPAASGSPYTTALTNVTVAQVLLRYLALEGVHKVFGIPGGGLLNLLVELKNQRETFDYIICRHETGAAYIAEITDQSECQTLFEQALRDALSLPPRAAHISLPSNVPAEIVPSIALPLSPDNYRARPG